MKKLNIIILLFFPILYLIITIIFLSNTPSFVINVDPEYCYLFNGLNLANFHLPWHIDHPGSPLQEFSAIIIWIVHLFNLSTSLIKDFLLNPEKFLTVIKISIDIVNSAALFIVGYFILKFSKNIFSAIFIQTAPFLSGTILLISNRLIVENFLIFIGLLLILLVYIFLHEKKYLENKIDVYIWLFALTIGLGIATKITFAPLFIVPFFLLNGFKKKFFYSLITLISFFVFAFPVIDRMDYFFNWIGALFVHSGVYGQGESNIINGNEFYNNLITMITHEKVLPFVIVILLITNLLYFIPFLKLKTINDYYYKALLAITLAIILTILIVAKQLKYYYLSPSLLLMAFGLYLTVKILSRKFNFLNKKIVFVPLLGIFFIYIFFTELTNSFAVNTQFNNSYAPLTKTYNKIHNKYNDLPLLIYSDYYGAPFKEYSLYFGINWSGNKMREKYNKALLELYPNSYIFHNWNNKFNYWDSNGYTLSKLLDKYKQLYLYLGNYEICNKVNNDLIGVNFQVNNNIKTMYFNNKSGQKVLKIKRNNIQHNWIICCSAEKNDSLNSFIDSLGVLFSGGQTRSSDFAFSGKFSSQLNKKNEFGIGTYLTDVKNGDHYLISVWKYNNGNKNSVLAIATTDFKKYSNSSNVPIAVNGKWEKIQIDLKINKLLEDEDFKICCWFNNDDIPAYFDDLTIEKLE